MTSFGTLLDRLIDDTLETSLCHFAPELALSGTIVALLLLRLFGEIDRWIPPYVTTLVGALVALGLCGTQLLDLLNGSQEAGEFFTGLLVFDHFGAFVRGLLALFLVLVVALTVLTGIPDREDGPDFYSLMLGSTIGMMIMASANHMLMFFVGIEMASVPGYVMVGFLKGNRKSSEAAFKYVVYGAGAAGVMLYGVSLLTGLLGTASLPELAARLTIVLGHSGGVGSAESLTALLAVLMVMVGLAFKLSLVPFHFWCPDVFEGASAEVAAFLSVASKGAAFALLVRFCMSLIGTDPGANPEFLTGIGLGLGVIAAVTVTFGNLAAYSQTNVKRLLAYSTIAHAGFMLMAVSALVVVLANGAAVPGFDVPEAARMCVEGLLFYLFVYLFMNLGAFAVVALLRNQTFSEDIESFNGVGWQSPALCICMAVCVFSLVGLPPLGGFWGKLVIFMSLFNIGEVHWFMWVLLVVGGLNTVFSLFYYIRILKAMFMREPAEGARPVEVPSAISNYALLIALPVLLLGLFPTWTTSLAHGVATWLIP
ncbi:MAG: NADH-quinone oxidoreductase subunit N [Planctomycetota bacterium]|nr:NADH-quinone oxidoreductase subunit N [Planctomycetota bacterium]MDA1165024.1 NADH-quinone oxidoreductase subunit N [Planctomycetota bacterium]